MSRFGVNLSQSQIKKSTPQELEERLRATAIEQIDGRDCSGLSKYLEPLFAERELAVWARDKFGIELTAEEISTTAKQSTVSAAESIVELIEGRARAAYARRDVEYPVNHVLTYAFGGEQGSTDNPYAADFVSKWIRSKYGIERTVDYIRGKSVRDLHDEMCGYQEELTRGGKLEKEIDEILKAGNTPSEQLKLFNNRFMMNLTDDIFKPETLPPAIRAMIGESAKESRGASSPMDVRTMLTNIARAHLRRELTDLEQYVLIQIFDMAWKDHLYALEMLKGSIGLQSFAEQDPRVLFKKEGYEYFQQLLALIRDKVTDQIFRAKLMGTSERKSNYRETAAVHADAGGYGVSENLRATGGGSEEAEDGTATAVKTIVREEPKIGRNDPCPCGSGKKYKKCHGADAA